MIGVFLVQSCQKENEVPEIMQKQLALKKFENLVRKSTSSLKLIAKIHKQPNLSAKYEAPSKFSVDKQKVKRTIPIKKHIKLSLAMRLVKYRKEQEAEKFIRPLIDGAKELLQQYGIKENDFNGVGHSNEAGIALIGLAVLASQNASYLNNNDVFDCAVRAAGVDILVELMHKGISAICLRGY